jgi:hypothetical protein
MNLLPPVAADSRGAQTAQQYVHLIVHKTPSVCPRSGKAPSDRQKQKTAPIAAPFVTAHE